MSATDSIVKMRRPLLRRKWLTAGRFMVMTMTCGRSGGIVTRTFSGDVLGKPPVILLYCKSNLAQYTADLDVSPTHRASCVGESVTIGQPATDNRKRPISRFPLPRPNVQRRHQRRNFPPTMSSPSNTPSPSSTASDAVPPSQDKDLKAFDRWRKSVAWITGTGLTPEAQAQRNASKAAEAEEAMWVRCEKWKADLMKNSRRLSLACKPFSD